MNKIERLSHYGILVIALCALFASIWQGRIAHRHNKLTVKPYLDSSIVQENDTHTVTFSNEGFGPAILKKISFGYQGETYGTLYEALEVAKEKSNITGSYNYGKNTVIAPGATKLLVSLKERRLRNITVTMVYESIYGEQFQFEFKF